MRLGAALLIPVLCSGLVSPAAAQRSTAPAGADLRGLSRALQSVATSVGPAVVQIRVTAYGPVSDAETPEALLGPQRSTGSGVILSSDGYLITNAHVVEGGRRFVVALARSGSAGAPGRSAVRPPALELPARLVGTDHETDLAVLKVDASDLAFATFGDSDSLQSGQLVLAFGSPLGLANSVTMGVVSAVGRQLHDEDRMLYIQTDTPINPGNSGGPLVNADGQVVGINTLIFSQSGGSEGIGFAAPSNIVRQVYQQIRNYRRVRRGEIGVFAQTITPALATGLHLPRDWGVILGDVYPKSPAARVGLLVGDIILSVDGKPMENGRQFDVTLYRRLIGDTVTLEVSRGAERRTVRVPVVERRNDNAHLGDMVTPEQNLISRLGILGLDFTPDLAQAIPGVRLPHGVVVAGVAGDVAEPAGLAPGDVIHSINGADVATLADLKAAISQIPVGGPAVLQVSRQGQLRYVTVPLE